jgi:serine/threonine-protein kinase
LIAEGGMGSIWTAHHLQLESTVAIKFIEPHIADSKQARSPLARSRSAPERWEPPRSAGG